MNQARKLWNDMSALNMEQTTPVLIEIFQKERKELKQLIKVFPFLKIRLVQCDEMLFDLAAPKRLLLGNSCNSLPSFNLSYSNYITSDNYGR